MTRYHDSPRHEGIMHLSALDKIADDVYCPPYEFQVGCLECGRPDYGGDEHRLGLKPSRDCSRLDHHWFIRAALHRQDSDTGEWGWGFGIHRLVPAGASESAAVRSFFVCARDFAEHEVREAFEWRGRRILGPHIDIEALWSSLGQEEEA